jgi:hypothetical protein
MKKLPIQFVAGLSILLLSAIAQATVAAKPGPMVVFKIHNTLNEKILVEWGQSGPHEAKTIRANNIGEYHIYAPVTMDVHQDGMFKGPCGIIHITKQPPTDFYVRASGKHGCKITRS